MNPAALADLGFAKLDLERADRCGFPEVVYGEGKPPAGLQRIVQTLHEAGQPCLVTRVTEEQAACLASAFPQARQNRLGRIFFLPAQDSTPLSGRVTVVTAGTADLPVAHEAEATAAALGCETELIADVGVAGLHRLLSQLDRLRRADVLIVVAGMEAALPSVVGGLVACPVIGVPTSVGYGTQFSGLTALLGMLNSCAANVLVVNIDAGFKAGYAAALMIRRLKSKG